MRRFTRLNRARVVIIFNDCTINGTGDLAIENEIEIEGEVPEGPKPVMIRTPADALTRVIRPVVTGALGTMGVATKAEIDGLVERTAALEEAKPTARKPAGKASKKPAKKAAKRPAKKAAKKKASKKPAKKAAKRPAKKAAKKAPAKKKATKA